MKAVGNNDREYLHGIPAGEYPLGMSDLANRRYLRLNSSSASNIAPYCRGHRKSRCRKPYSPTALFLCLGRWPRGRDFSLMWQVIVGRCFKGEGEGGHESHWRRRGCIHHGDGGDESVSSPCERLYKAGILGIVPQGLTDLIDSCAEGVVEIDICSLLPYPLLQLFAGDNLPGTLNQFGENTEGLTLKLDAKTTSPELSRRQIGFKCTEGNTYGIGGLTHTAAA